MVRKTLAVLGGILAGGFVVALVESLGGFVHPLPQGIDINNYDAMVEHAKKAPLLAQLLVIAGWALAALVAGIISTLIAKNGKSIQAIICALLFIVSSIFNMVMIPTPIWFWIVGIAIWIPLAWLGYKLATGKNKYTT